MMNKLRVVSLGAVAVLIGTVACNNDKLTSLNVNPNNPEDVPATTIFTMAERSAVAEWLGGGIADLRGTEWLVQHLAEVQYPDEDDYKRLQASSTSGLFDAPYRGELEDLQKVILKGTKANSPGTYAPAQILRTWDFSYLTNTFGDIPYFQALKGDSIGSTLTPAYDMQKNIYADFFSVLDAASKSLSTAANALGAADPLYNGDPKSWQRFANSLRARLALQLVNVDPTTANTQLTAAFAAPSGVFASNAQSAVFPWPGDGVYNNPWADNFTGRDDHRMSQTLMNIMLSTNDPRIGIYAQPTADWEGGVAGAAKYAGMPNGLTQSTASVYFTSTSRPGAIFYPGQTIYGFFGGSGKGLPAYVMTYAEVAFIEAEAAERSLGGLTPAQAPAFYNAAIKASMEQWGVTDAATIANFISGPQVAYQAGTAGLTQIAVQKWIALYTDGAQAWAEWRRTCQPSTLVPGPFAIIGTVPRRFEYSNTETSVNGSELSKAVSRQGADLFQTRMYWDMNPSAAPTYPGATCGTR